MKFYLIGNLEFNFDISFNILSRFFRFSLALAVSVDKAIAIDDLAEFSLLLIDASVRTIRTFFRLNITADRIQFFSIITFTFTSLEVFPKT